MPPFFNGLRRDNEDSDEGGSGDDSRDWKGIRKANLKELEKHEREHQRRKQHQEEISISTEVRGSTDIERLSRETRRDPGTAERGRDSAG
jgi:hypothetical protein